MSNYKAPLCLPAISNRDNLLDNLSVWLITTGNLLSRSGAYRWESSNFSPLLFLSVHSNNFRFRAVCSQGNSLTVQFCRKKDCRIHQRPLRLAPITARNRQRLVQPPDIKPRSPLENRSHVLQIRLQIDINHRPPWVFDLSSPARPSSKVRPMLSCAGDHAFSVNSWCIIMNYNS